MPLTDYSIEDLHAEIASRKQALKGLGLKPIEEVAGAISNENQTNVMLKEEPLVNFPPVNLGVRAKVRLKQSQNQGDNDVTSLEDTFKRYESIIAGQMATNEALSSRLNELSDEVKTLKKAIPSILTSILNNLSIKNIKGLEDRLLTVEETAFTTASIPPVPTDLPSSIFNDVYLHKVNIAGYESEKAVEIINGIHNAMKSAMKDCVIITMGVMDEDNDFKLIKQASAKY